MFGSLFEVDLSIVVFFFSPPFFLFFFLFVLFCFRLVAGEIDEHEGEIFIAWDCSLCDGESFFSRVI